MTWKAASYESIDIRDGQAHDIFIGERQEIEIPKEKRRGDKKSVPKYRGLEKEKGPVEFLATDDLSKTIDNYKLPQLFRVSWRGKRTLSDGRSFNVFSVLAWEGSEPAWVEGGGFTSVKVVGTPEPDDEMPF